MSPVVVNVVVKRGRHAGRLYPARLRSEAETLRVVGLVHVLRCRDRLTYREIIRALENYGCRVSLGSVYTYATQWRCERCREPDPGPAQAAQVQPDRGQGGGLTDGLPQGSSLTEGLPGR